MTVGVDDGLTAGVKYRFVVKAKNQFGLSEPSTETTVAIGRRPQVPDPVRKVESLSSLTTIVVEWDEVPAIDDIITTGYILYIDDGRNGDFKILYDGTNNFYTLSFAATGLETGLPYRFKIIALNINGESEASEETTIYACVKPNENGKPFKISTTETTVTLGWNEPKSEGCPLQSFSIFRDNGLVGVSEAVDIEVDPEIVNDKPSMREYTITGLTQTGSIYRFFVRAYNSAGYSDSSIVKIVLSSVPNTPALGPTSDASKTNESRISVLYGPQAESENGGSPILSYDLQIDYSNGDGFKSLIGGDGFDHSLETSLIVEQNIVTGAIYRFRYRTLNINGWSEFSPITYIKAATSPERPPAPTFVTATADSITINLYQTINTGGSEIQSYQLYRNQGGVSTEYTLVSTYNGQASQHTLTVADDALQQGIIYKLRSLAVNAYGSSELSEEVNAGVSSFPAKPNPVRKIQLESSKTSITLEWDTSADTELSVIGYLLKINDGSSDDYTVVYDGKNFPNVRKYLVSGLSTGDSYSFTI